MCLGKCWSANPNLCVDDDNTSEEDDNDSDLDYDSDNFSLGPPPPHLCSRPSCSNPTDTNKRCAKCLVTSYCSRECQVADWDEHKERCKADRRFTLTTTTEEHLLYLKYDFTPYFLKEFAGNETAHLRFKEDFDKLGDIGDWKGKDLRGITTRILEIIRGNDIVKLRALANLASRECFHDAALYAAVIKSLFSLEEEAYFDGKLSHGDYYGSQLRRARICDQYSTFDELFYLLDEAQFGYEDHYGENSAKALEVAGQSASFTDDIEDLTQLWARAKESVPDDPVTFGIACKLAAALRNEKRYEEAMKYYKAALEGQRRVLGEDHHDTLHTR